ncbi:hypothetical protein L1887_36396 [Cichorium endivia]|nr:hypothetical protein L1887_36396 [Cichorium endivia]
MLSRSEFVTLSLSRMFLLGIAVRARSDDFGLRVFLMCVLGCSVSIGIRLGKAVLFQSGLGNGGDAYGRCNKESWDEGMEVSVLFRSAAVVRDVLAAGC